MQTKPSNPANSEDGPNEGSFVGPDAPGSVQPERAAAGPVLRWAILLFLLGGLLALLLGGPTAP